MLNEIKPQLVLFAVCILLHYVIKVIDVVASLF